jgi:hypothetical protein
LRRHNREISIILEEILQRLKYRKNVPDRHHKYFGKTQQSKLNKIRRDSVEVLGN